MTLLCFTIINSVCAQSLDDLNYGDSDIGLNDSVNPELNRDSTFKSLQSTVIESSNTDKTEKTNTNESLGAKAISSNCEKTDTYEDKSVKTSTAKASNTTQVKENKTSMKITTLAKSASSYFAYVKKNGKLPNPVSISNKKYQSAQYLYLVSKAVSNISASTVEIKDFLVNNFSYINYKTANGTLSKKECEELANKTARFIEKNHRAPTWIGSDKGNIPCNQLILLFTKCLDYYNNNSKLPSSVKLSDVDLDKISGKSNVSSSKASNSSKNAGNSEILLNSTLNAISSILTDLNSILNPSISTTTTITISSNSKTNTTTATIKTNTTVSTKSNTSAKTNSSTKTNTKTNSSTKTNTSAKTNNSTKTNTNTKVNTTAKTNSSTKTNTNTKVNTTAKTNTNTATSSSSKNSLSSWVDKAITAVGKSLIKFINSSILNDKYNGESLKKYLSASKNCQSTSSTIKSLAKKLTSSLTSDYDKGEKIFNWVRDNIEYQKYSNTKKGALNTLNSKSANCVDQAHLVVALARAAGLPARYVNANNCKFTSGYVSGHVWAQILVGITWVVADTTSSRNSFGIVKNWDVKNYKLVGKYSSISF